MEEEVKQVLIGSLLGDGNLHKTNKSINCYFREAHSPKQKDYLLWKSNILSRCFSMRFYNYNNFIWAYSNCSSELETYFKQIYPLGKGNKTFPDDLIKEIDYLALAVWYMDDGSFDKRYKKATFAIHKINKGFSQKVLIKFNLKFLYKSQSNTNGGVLVLNRENSLKLFRMIHNFIHPLMKYKIKISREEDLINKAKVRDYYRSLAQKIKKKEYDKKLYLNNREEILERDRVYRNKSNVKLRRKKYHEKWYQERKHGH